LESNGVCRRSHHYWWRPTYFLRASCSGSAFSAPVVSVSISVVLRGAKKLRVNTVFGGSLTAADVGTVLVDFLAVRYH
jgi:hypothetical protein